MRGDVVLIWNQYDIMAIDSGQRGVGCCKTMVGAHCAFWGPTRCWYPKGDL